MPATISVAAFIVGLLLVVAALVGQSIKAKEIELSAITGRKRIIIGLFGAALMLFGINDGKLGTMTNAVTVATSSTPVTMASDVFANPNFEDRTWEYRFAC